MKNFNIQVFRSLFNPLMIYNGKNAAQFDKILKS